LYKIKEFWVGLMEGDGSIQVNHWRKKLLQYRLVIKLKYTEANEKMLKIISKEIGGFVRKDKEYVYWVENTKERIVELIKIFEEFPPLTGRKKCQLKFLKSCLEHNNIERYFKERDEKYSTIYQNLFKFTNINELPSYFPSWLSGFIEAEGCFSITAKNVLSFSIAQKYEKDLINCIKSYFSANSNIVLIKELFEIKIYNRNSLESIITHCTNYPLLGEKKESLEKFKLFFYK
jgi:hypothetical protein